MEDEPLEAHYVPPERRQRTENEPLEVTPVSQGWTPIAPQNWEYQLEVVSDGFGESLLNEKGAEGWELVQILLFYRFR